MKGFLATFKYRDSIGDEALTETRIFIPVENRSYAWVIANGHKRIFGRAGIDVAETRLDKAELHTTPAGRADTPLDRTV